MDESRFRVARELVEVMSSRDHAPIADEARLFNLGVLETDGHRVRKSLTSYRAARGPLGSAVLERVTLGELRSQS